MSSVSLPTMMRMDEDLLLRRNPDVVYVLALTSLTRGRFQYGDPHLGHLPGNFSLLGYQACPQRLQARTGRVGVVLIVTPQGAPARC